MELFNIYVIYTAKDADSRTKFLQELHDSGVVAAVRAEDGCLRYDYYTSYQDDVTILLVEQWESEHHQKVHITQPHIATLRQIKEKYIADSRLGKIQFE